MLQDHIKWCAWLLPISCSFYWRMARLSWLCWLVTYRDDLPVPVLTGSDVEQLRWPRPTHYHLARLLHYGWASYKRWLSLAEIDLFDSGQCKLCYRLLIHSAWLGYNWLSTDLSHCMYVYCVLMFVRTHVQRYGHLCYVCVDVHDYYNVAMNWFIGDASVWVSLIVDNCLHV